MGKFSEISAGEVSPKTVLQFGVQPSRKSRFCAGSREETLANCNTRKKPRNYTTEERRRGALKCAVVKRDRAYAAIDDYLACYVKIEEYQSHFDEKRRFSLIDFCRQALPNIGAHWARRQYGAYIKARLKYFEESKPVFNLASLVNKIRAGLAKKRGMPTPTGIFESMKGWVHRLSCNPFTTSCRHSGAEWIDRMGIWGRIIDCDTGEVL